MSDDLETQVTKLNKRIYRLERLLAHLLHGHNLNLTGCSGKLEKDFIFSVANQSVNLEMNRIELMKGVPANAEKRS